MSKNLGVYSEKYRPNVPKADKQAHYMGDIIEEFNGFNVKELASKYRMSESYVRAIIRKNK